MTPTEDFQLTPRWTTMRHHEVQLAWMRSPTRFNIVPAGRRSGKTERAKRKLVRRALSAASTPWADPNFFAAAPTRDQAKRLYWEHLKQLVPREFVTEIRESELIIKLVNGASIYVLGMDKPERIEGSPWDGGILDEYGNMKKQTWGSHVRPALADRKGWCDFIGVPEGRNHYYDLTENATNYPKDWSLFSWPSSDILDPEEIASARVELDPLIFDQEYNASFLNFVGLIYYNFNRAKHASIDIKYNPNLALIFCFDFNIAPGVCAIVQEVPKLPNGQPGTAVVDEVWIPRGSNTQMVCRKLVEKYGKHQAGVYCFGDATGGGGGSAKLNGSDWDIIRAELRPVYQGSLKVIVPDGNPAERARVNAVNTRLLTGSGAINLMVHPKKAEHVMKDFEGVRAVEGGSGEIEKKSDKSGSELTHISDAIGYYVHYRFPITKGIGQREF